MQPAVSSQQSAVSSRLELVMFDPKKKLPPMPDADRTAEYLCFCRDGDLSFWQVLEWDGEDFLLRTLAIANRAFSLLMETPYTEFVVRWMELPADPV